MCVLGLEVAQGGKAALDISQEEEERFGQMAKDPEIREKIYHSMAPSIRASDKDVIQDVKRAVACLLFGGSRKYLPDGTRMRGDINILLLGDPGTAKSQFLKFAEKAAPIAVYTSGKGSSAAGLTCTNDLFHCDYDFLSLTNEDLNSITTTGNNRAYPRMIPEEFHAIGLRWHAYIMSNGFAHLQKCWLALLVPVGSALFKLQDARAVMLGIVLNVTEHYCLLWKPKIVQQARVFHWSKGSLEMCLLEDLEYMCCELEALSPGEHHIKHSKYVLAIKPCRPLKRLTVASALTSFERLSKLHLEKLWDLLEVPGDRRPTTPAALLRGLARFILPLASDEQIEEIVAGWKKRPARDTDPVPTVLGDAEGECDLDDDDGSDEDALNKTFKRFKTKVGGAGSSSGAAPPSGAPVFRKPLLPDVAAWGDEDPDRDWVALLIPVREGCRISKEVLFHRRWRVWYLGAAQLVYSVTWTPEKSPLNALKELLGTVWALHEKSLDEIGQPGHSCPFDLDKLPEIVAVG